MHSLLPLLAKENVKIANLERIYAAHGGQPGFADAALSAMRLLDPELAWRAVWLLKQLALDGKLGATELERLARSADELTHWASQLDLCQLFARTGVPSSVRELTYPFFLECTSNKRVIIRAWAISVLVTFCDDPKYRKSVAALLREAKKDAAPSMIARLRHLPTMR